MIILILDVIKFLISPASLIYEWWYYNVKPRYEVPSIIKGTGILYWPFTCVTAHCTQYTGMSSDVYLSQDDYRRTGVTLMFVLSRFPGDTQILASDREVSNTPK